jgi:hypothetical protein
MECIEMSAMAMTQTPRPNPYVGPRAFKRGEVLYGRDGDVLNLYYLLLAERVVLLFSPSGAGKSSLIQAGLIPRLEEKFGSISIIRVNQEPPEGLSSLKGFNRYVFSALLSLEETAPEDNRLPAETLAALSLSSYLTQRVHADPRQDESAKPVFEALIFDQFEEVLTTAPNDYEAKIAFFDQLGDALRDTRRWALFSAREDYAAAFEPYLRAIPTRFSNRYRLDLLGAEMALEAIQKPAQEMGVDFSNAAAWKLVDDLRRIQTQRPDGTTQLELGRYVEPVQLQVVCYRLWQGLSDTDTVIDETHLAGVGNVNQSLADYYSASVKGAAEKRTVSERLIRDWFDQKLITPDGIRGQVLMRTEKSEGLPNPVVRLLEDAHVIRGEKRAGKTWYELAHDRLIEPVRKSNAAWRDANLSMVQRQAELWEQQDQPEGLLLRGKALSDAEQWALDHKAEATEVEDFLAACRKARAAEQRDRRNNRLIRGLAVVATITAIVAVVLGITARQQADLAIAGRLDTQASALPATRLDRQLLLRVLANDMASSQQVRNNLQESLKKTAGLRFFLRGHTKPINSLVFSPKSDRAVLASGSQDNTVRLWDVKQGTPIGDPLTGHTDQVRSVAFNPREDLNGNLLASTGNDARVFLWNIETRQPIAQVQLAAPGVSLAFSPDGKWLAVGKEDGTIDLRAADSLELMGSLLEGHTGPVLSLVFSDDGAALFSGGQDRQIIRWSLATSQPVTRMQADGKVVVLSTVGDDYVALGEESPDVFDIRGSEDLERKLFVPVAPRGRPLLVAYDSISGTVLYAGSNNDLAEWDWQQATVNQPLLGYEGPIDSAAYWHSAQSADGLQYVSSLDGTILVWATDQAQRSLPNVSSSQAGDEACKQAGRNLSAQEWQEYMPGVPYRKVCAAFPAEN